MTDMEKVINHLQIIRTWAVVDRNYGGINPDCCDDIVKWIDEALELLKEQEPVKPRFIDGKRNHFVKCGNCNLDLMHGMKFCPNCGRRVKWG